jgi:hypothetical protein
MLLGGFGVAFTAAATVLFPIGFALLAAAAALTLDEPASQVVDVTPTGALTRTSIRALALFAPLTTGVALILAGAVRGLALPWAPTTLALAGNIMLGFAVACVARTRTGEPGAAASTAVAVILILPGLIPPLSHRITTFPTTSGNGLSSNTVWSAVLPVCVLAIAASASERRLSRRFLGRRRLKPPGLSGSLPEARR